MRGERNADACEERQRAEAGVEVRGERNADACEERVAWR